ncbi:tetratricopeptide repeat protein [Leptolyngbya sp. AN02str]|uniref:tetratricopeptide repeat protein n=1 Tax=Leptolyngbya sp. AN02str TaxID=3423363 RepID=UPI003D323A07
MNTRSSTSHQGKSGQSGSAATQSHLTGRSSKRQTKRWQPRQRRQESVSGHNAVSPAEWEILTRQQALTEAQCGHYNTAIALFTEILTRNPLSARDYNNRGLVYFQSGRTDKAIADYNQALELNPSLDSAYNNRANYFASQGQYLEAVLDYDAALELNPDNVRAWINQGITFRDMQMYERAIESFDVAIGLGCLQSHVYSERGRTHHLWGDWNCAIADYKRSLSYLQLPNATAGNVARLLQQVETWMNDLLSPLAQ